jgi:hypothetical protein
MIDILVTNRYIGGWQSAEWLDTGEWSVKKERKESKVQSLYTH